MYADESSFLNRIATFSGTLVIAVRLNTIKKNVNLF